LTNELIDNWKKVFIDIFLVAILVLGIMINIHSIIQYNIPYYSI
jgi:hypothetical protein